MLSTLTNIYMHHYSFLASTREYVGVEEQGDGGRDKIGKTWMEEEEDGVEDGVGEDGGGRGGMG